MVFDKTIKIQKCDEFENWVDLRNPIFYASINKSSSSNNEYLSAGSERSSATKTFEIRYVEALQDIAFNTQSYRIVYEGHNYNIKDYDDFMEKHKTIRLLGVAYGN